MKTASVTDGQYRICSKILQKDEITYDDFIYTKNLLYKLIHEDDLSPREINEKYNLGYKDFGCPLKHNFKIKLKSLKEAVNNYNKQVGKIITNEKELYRKNCQFNFNPYQETKIVGYELLEKYSFSTPQNKEKDKLYLHRDHMVSVAYGWENNIPSEHISHPANCELLFEIDNIKKSSGCSITYEELLFRIEKWNTDEKLPINKTDKIYRNTKKIISTNHRKAISNRMINGVIYNNGKNFKYILPGEEIPTGFVLGKLEIRNDNGNKLGRIEFLDRWNKTRINNNLQPIPEYLRNTIFGSEHLCEKFFVNLDISDINHEITRIKNIITNNNFETTKDVFKFFNIKYNNHVFLNMYKNFMKL